MQYRRLSSPISVQVETTELCDNNCIHCYNHWRDQAQVPLKRFLDARQLGFITDKLIESKVFTVTLTGGEPLIYWKFLLATIAKFRSNDVEVSLNSNLTRLTKEISFALQESGLTSVLTSVLSCNKEIHDKIACRRGAWQRTIDGIKIAVSTGLYVSANMVLLKDNYSTLYETAVFLKNLGVKSFSATKASPALNSRNFEKHLISINELRQSLVLLKKIEHDLNMSVGILECYPLCLIEDIGKFQHFTRRSCTAGVTTCTIGATGDIRPCSHADISYGNIFENDIQSIWECMDDWRAGKYIPTECQECKFLSLCSGGCRMEAKYRGDISGKDPYMTDSSEVKVSDDIISNNKKEKERLKMSKAFRINPNIKIRKEDFGAIMRANKGHYILINEEARQLIQSLSAEDYFFPNQLHCEINTTPNDLHGFLAAMIKNGAIQEIVN